jgi:hypothetical protein
MLLLLIILIGLCTVSGAVAVWMELSIMNDSLIWLEERLNKLEKDAVKVTFNKPNPKQFDGIKSEEPFVKTRTKRKPKTTKDWEDEFDLGGHE